MPKAKLTTKQENFAVEYVLSGDASAAYRKAYNADKMKNPTINVKACELLKSGNVSVRVAELMDEASKTAAKEFSISVKQRLKWLKEITEAGLDVYLDAQGNQRREALGASRSAIETMNAMLGVTEKGDGVKPVKVMVGVVDAS